MVRSKDKASRLGTLRHEGWLTPRNDWSIRESIFHRFCTM
jgi:hypothetical protein